jgi:hypothetical protein
MRELLFISESYAPKAVEDDNGMVDLNEAFDAREDIMEPSDRHQLWLMQDAGWIEGRHAEEGFFRITSRGHDYLDAVRNDGIWAQTREAVRDAGGSATLEIVKAVAIGFVRKKLEQHTGLEL